MDISSAAAMDFRNPGMLESFSSGKVPSSVPEGLKKFYRGEPMALGITQIFIGILGIAFGLLIHLNDDPYQFIISLLQYCTGILYIISGSLSVAAAKNPRMPLVKGALGMNVVSAVAAGLGIAFFSVFLERLIRPANKIYCQKYHNETIQICQELHIIPHNTVYNTVLILFAVTILQFIITFVSAAFGCASVCRNTYSETTIVIFSNTEEGSAPSPPAP